MPTVRRFEDLEAWQTARRLARLVYRLTANASFARDFGLKDQIQRAAVSVMSNIAEGFESLQNTQFVRYLGYAKASAGEVRAQLYIAHDLGYITDAEFEEAFALAERASRQLASFISYLKNSPYKHRLREDGPDYNP